MDGQPLLVSGGQLCGAPGLVPPPCGHSRLEGGAGQRPH